jgi:uncharacterized protein (TIGR03437 family)
MLFGAVSPALGQGVITTVAGTTWIYRGDTGPALNAPLGQIWGVALDAAGNLFAADIGNHLVVRISPDGVLTAVAGNGVAAFSGDGGSATSASLSYPMAAVFDATGNLYIADRNNSRIRKVSPNGTITTVAGSGVAGFSGDGGPATLARLRAPSGLAVDSAGNLYVSDGGDNRIRKVGSGGIIATVAGNGAARFSGDGGPAAAASLNSPQGVALDAAGNLYIADYSNSCVRKVNASNGIITTVAGTGFRGYSGDGGPATAAKLITPAGVAVDSDGSIYIADFDAYAIRRVNPQGTITTVAGGNGNGFSGDGGPATKAKLGWPRALAFDAAGNLFIGENPRIRKVSPSGVITTVAGNGRFRFSGDGGPAVSATLASPVRAALDLYGNLYIGDWRNNRVRKVAADGTITTLAGNGTPDFFGDGGPATSASLNGPDGVAVSPTGDVYVGDRFNNRVRKVSPDGKITTVAGTGVASFSGDGGPATAASLVLLSGLALDAAGNLYIVDNDRVRKVTPAGIISTVAGTGVAGFSGDGGPATAAALFLSTGVSAYWGATVDGAGNLYFSDGGNHRVRRVDAGGTITTYAGNGTARFSGDGGPAIAASLNTPEGLALDTAGNLYIADMNNGRVRKVSVDGVIATVAGNGSFDFSGDGGPATRASIQPFGVAVDAAGNLYIADNKNYRIRKVLAAPPSFSVSPSKLTFSVPAGTLVLTTQQAAVTSGVMGLAWGAQASTESGGNWLLVSPPTGSVPRSIDVSVDASKLAEGTYRGMVAVTAPLAMPITQTVTVELTVVPAVATQLVVEPSSLTVETATGASDPPSQTLRISNAGGGTLAWTARAETTSGGNWLSVSPASGSFSAGSAAAVQVSVNVTGLTPGVYSGAVVVESSTTNQTQRIPVTLLLSAQVQTILVSQNGLLFTGVEGGTVVPSQSIGILNAGQGVMNWTVRTETLSGGNWLRMLSATAGRSDAASTEVPLIDVAVNVTGLRAGRYSGLIRVESSTARNSPQLVSVDLNVLPRGSNPGVLVRPTGLIFATQAETSSPGSQTVRLATAGTAAVDARSGVLTLDGGDWLEALPLNFAISVTDPQTVTVQPTLGTLTSGVYRGGLTLLFGDGSLQNVNILFLVVARPAGAAVVASYHTPGDGGDGVVPLDTTTPCVPTRLHAVHRSLGSSFSSPAGWPSAIEVQVADDCGAAVANATVVASFTNGDPPLVLSSLKNGTYIGTWRPSNAATQVVVTVRASLPPLTPVEIQALGAVGLNPSAPALNSGGIVNGASFAPGVAVAPGAIIAVFGRNLARGQNSASRVPLDTTLGGAALNIGGRDAPLFFSSDGQINAQLPFELTANTRHSAVVKTRLEATGSETFAVPETITVTASQPGIFTTNQQGTGQGAIRDAQGRLVDTAAPAAAGDIVQVYCTGLGTTQPAIASGQAAPSAEPLARVTLPVTATIGGKSAVVHYAGLAPGFVGLYQVNVQIPGGITPGSAVPLVLTQNGVPSNTVTLAIK